MLKQDLLPVPRLAPIGDIDKRPDRAARLAGGVQQRFGVTQKGSDRSVRLNYVALALRDVLSEGRHAQGKVLEPHLATILAHPKGGRPDPDDTGRGEGNAHRQAQQFQPNPIAAYFPAVGILGDKNGGGHRPHDGRQLQRTALRLCSRLKQLTLDPFPLGQIPDENKKMREPIQLNAANAQLNYKVRSVRVPVEGLD